MEKHSFNKTSLYKSGSGQQGIFENKILSPGENQFNFYQRMTQKKGYVISIRNDIENIASALVLSDGNVIKMDKPVNNTDDIH